MTRIFGYLRFSYMGSSDVKLARNTPTTAHRASLLYAPTRMEERFYFFEKLCLPSLRWQTDQDHLLVNAHGWPMGTEVTPGQTSDCLGFDPVMADNLPQPGVLLADRG